jgi:hypothetical protein
LTFRVLRAISLLMSIATMTMLSSCSESDDDGPVGPGGPECRTYPTSMTDVTLNNVSTVRVTYNGTHDTTTHRTTYNVNYSDTPTPPVRSSHTCW